MRLRVWTVRPFSVLTSPGAGDFFGAIASPVPGEHGPERARRERERLEGVWRVARAGGEPTKRLLPARRLTGPRETYSQRRRWAGVALGGGKESLVGGKEALQRYYAGGLQRCLDTWKQLDEGDWAAKDPHGPWTARDYLAHLGTSEQFDVNAGTAANLAGRTTDLPGPSSPRDVDAFNARNLETVRDLSPQELMQRLSGLVEEHLGMLAPLSEADLERPAVNPGLHWPITIEITFDLGYVHLPLHYQDIRRCLRRRRRLPHWMDLAGEEETHDTMDRAFRLMPAFYWAERGRGLRANILFTLAGRGGGQWTVEIDDGRCSSHAGPPERVNVEIRATPALYLDMQAGEMNPIRSFLSGGFRVRPLTKLGLANRLEKLFAIT